MTQPQYAARDETDARVAGLLGDVQYALKQLREHRNVRRAVDALERVETGLVALGCQSLRCDWCGNPISLDTGYAECEAGQLCLACDAVE